MRRRTAFTLMELLIVAAIVAVLVGLLAGALARARVSALSVACQSSLRQWAAGMHLYVTSNSGIIPRRGQGVLLTTVLNRPEDWFNALPPMLNMTDYASLAAAGQRPQVGTNSLWLCPSAVDNDAPNFFTYGMNMRLSTWFTPMPEHIEQIADPTTQVFMSEGSGGYGSLLPSKNPYTPIARHAGRVNISFLDGHVDSFTGDYVGCGIGDPQRFDVRWIVPGDPWPGPNN